MTLELGGEFCLVCGAEPPLFGDRMCEPCLRKRIHLVKVPENVPWVRCARCGIVEIQGKWVLISEEEIWDELIQRHVVFHKDAENIGLAHESRTVSDRHTLLHLQVEGTIEGLSFKEEHTMRARMANGVCLTCTRRAGNYFEATVQLRSTGRRLSEDEFTDLRITLDKVMEEMADDPMFFITSEGPVTGGYDIVLGNKGLARTWGRHLVSEYGGHIAESNTVAGRKDGVDVTRLTLLYRKPGYEIGDVLRWRDKLWRAASWTKEGAIMSRIDRQERTGASWRDLESANVMTQMGEHNIVDLITQDASVGEFLDPSTWQMTSVRLPWDYLKTRPLRVTQVEGEWVALHHLGCDEKEAKVKK
jgi:nonsense-mediated mRNA decay protein 3|tara:strand:- start:13725 stop:14804 length:1080 start_codon:yes stop_codon:yes gene_type:complete